MPLAFIVVGRSCRRRGLSTCRSHALLLAGAAAGEEPAHAACMHCCWQVLPPAWHQRTLLASIVAGRSCRRRGTSTRRWHPLLLAGAAAGETTAHAACMHCCCQVLPVARLRRMPFASIVAAAGEAPAHAACMHCCGQVLPLSRHRRVTFASSVAGRRCRRRDLSVCRLHAFLLAGAAAFEASAHAVYIQCCWQELPPARPQRMPLACIVAGRSGRRRGLSACRLQPIFAGRSCQRHGFGACRLLPLMLAGAAAGEAPAHAACMHGCWQVRPPARS